MLYNFLKIPVLHINTPISVKRYSFCSFRIITGSLRLRQYFVKHFITFPNFVNRVSILFSFFAVFLGKRWLKRFPCRICAAKRQFLMQIRAHPPEVLRKDWFNQSFLRLFPKHCPLFSLSYFQRHFILFDSMLIICAAASSYHQILNHCKIPAVNFTMN